MSEPFAIPGQPDLIFTQDPGNEFLKRVVEPVLEARDDMSEAHKERRCVKPPLGCGEVITDEQWAAYKPLDAKEYKQSGWCLPCQNEVFGSDDDECTCDSPCCEADVGVGTIDCGSQHCRIHGGK